LLLLSSGGELKVAAFATRARISRSAAIVPHECTQEIKPRTKNIIKEKNVWQLGQLSGFG